MNPAHGSLSKGELPSLVCGLRNALSVTETVGWERKFTLRKSKTTYVVFEEDL